jgi:hypothetical protein
LWRWFSGSSCGGQGIQYKLQGNLKLGSTLVLPNKSNLVCDGASGGGAFVSRGPNCGIQAPAVYGTLGSTVSAGSVSFTPTFTGGSIANLPVGSAISVGGNTTCTITSIARTSASISATSCAVRCLFKQPRRVTMRRSIEVDV